MAYKEFEFEGTVVRFDVDESTMTGEQTVSRKIPSITAEHLKQTLSPIMKIGKSVVDEAVALTPNEVSVTMGLDISLETGNICWGIAKGTATTHFNLTMTWKE